MLMFSGRMLNFQKNNNWLDTDVIYFIENSSHTNAQQSRYNKNKKLSAHIIVRLYPRVFAILQYQLDNLVRIAAGKTIELYCIGCKITIGEVKSNLHAG